MFTRNPDTCWPTTRRHIAEGHKVGIKHAFQISGLHAGDKSPSSPDRFNPRKNSLEYHLARRFGGAQGPCGLPDKKKNHCTCCSFIFVTVLTELLRSLYLVDRLYEYQANARHHSKLESFEGWRFLCVPPTGRRSKSAPPTVVFMCFVWISEQTAIISLVSVNWLVCITEIVCLLRGTDWVFK
jgi:hypothetical protein